MSGESVNMVTERLKEGGFTIANEDLKLLWNPINGGIATCTAFGRDFARNLVGTSAIS